MIKGTIAKSNNDGRITSKSVELGSPCPYTIQQNIYIDVSV